MKENDVTPVMNRNDACYLARFISRQTIASMKDDDEALAIYKFYQQLKEALNDKQD